MSYTKACILVLAILNVNLASANNFRDSSATPNATDSLLSLGCISGGDRSAKDIFRRGFILELEVNLTTKLGCFRVFKAKQKSWFSRQLLKSQEYIEGKVCLKVNTPDGNYLLAGKNLNQPLNAKISRREYENSSRKRWRLKIDRTSGRAILGRTLTEIKYEFVYNDETGFKTFHRHPKTSVKTTKISTNLECEKNRKFEFVEFRF